MIFQDRKNPASQDRRTEAGGYGGKALPADHLPIRLRRSFPYKGPDLAERSRQHPHCNPHIHTGADQPAAAAHLNGYIHRDKTRNKRDNQEYRINTSDKQRSPQAGKHGREKAMVFAQQDRKNKGRKGVGNQQRHQLKVDVPRRGLRKNDFNGGKLNKQDAENQGYTGIASERLWVIDPKLGHGGDEDEQAKKKLFCRFLLLAGKDQGGQAANESGENEGPDGPRAFESIGKLAIADRAARLAAGHAFADKAAALEEVPHR